MLELYYQQSLGNLAGIDSCHNANTLGYDRSFLIVFSYLISQLFLHVLSLPIDCNNFFLELQAHTFCTEYESKHTFPE